jgi:23S rRNA pseudouridine1911/1915/1917 synthase
MSPLFTIQYQDDFLLVINKPSGLSVNNITNFHLVHRLDQRVSGLMLLAKNATVAAVLSKQFQNNQITKMYKAIVANKPPEEAGELIHWLQKNSVQKKASVVAVERKGYKKAILHYTTLASSEKYFLLKVQLSTGRFHQIRAQLSSINCPIVGDLKYGFKRSTSDGSIFLQAYQLEFKHPVTLQNLRFEIAIPEAWHQYGF